jgi:hypothetical protein
MNKRDTDASWDHRTFLVGLNEWLSMALEDGVVVTEDGCTVEADGVCPHEFKSPLLIAGVL